MKIEIPEQIIKSFLTNNFTVKKTSTGEFRINSPFTDDKTYKLYINEKTGMFMDFKTNTSGNFIKFVSLYMDIDEQEVPYSLIKEFGKKDTKVEEILPVAKNLELPDGLTRFYEKEKIGLMGSRAIAYFKSRKIEPRMDFGYIFKPSSEYNNRVFIPFYEDGEIVYFLTRTFIDDPLRFKNPPGFDSKNYVFNIDQMNGGNVLLCEGVFDALSIKEPVASCMLSADLGRQQAIKIFNKSPAAIIMVPDNDETGFRTLKRNIELLRLYKPQSLNTKFYVYTLPEGIKDLNELLVKTGKDKITLAECKEIQKENISLKQSQMVVVGI